MTRIITVASGKGGVGKTTVVSNLANVLAQLGKSVIAVDGNLTTSNLGLHLGLPLYPVTLQDVLKRRARVLDAVYSHPLGFKVIPADIAISKMMIPEGKRLLSSLYSLIGKTDFILIDTAAGLGKEAQASLEAADEVLVVTNPELPAVTDALKLVKVAEKYQTEPAGVILNKVRRHQYEFSAEGVEDFLGVPVIATIPYDPHVVRSIANKTPVVTYKPRSLAAQHFIAAGSYLVGRRYKIRTPVTHKLFHWLRTGI